jgi:hypothetical protein
MFPQLTTLIDNTLSYLPFLMVLSYLPFLMVFVDVYTSVHLRVNQHRKVKLCTRVLCKRFSSNHRYLTSFCNKTCYLDNGWGHQLSSIELIAYIWQLLSHEDKSVKDYIVLNYARQVIYKGWHLLTCGTHLHDRIISLREVEWVHKTSLAPPLFIEVTCTKPG